MSFAQDQFGQSHVEPVKSWSSAPARRHLKQRRPSGTGSTSNSDSPSPRSPSPSPSPAVSGAGPGPGKRVSKRPISRIDDVDWASTSRSGATSSSASPPPIVITSDDALERKLVRALYTFMMLYSQTV